VVVEKVHLPSKQTSIVVWFSYSNSKIKEKSYLPISQNCSNHFPILDFSGFEGSSIFSLVNKKLVNAW
jgi:hypothetical protein